MAILKIQLYPSGAERSYNKLLQDFVTQLTTETEKQIRDANVLRIDGFSEDLTYLLAGMLEFGMLIANPVIFRLPEVYANINTFNDRQWRLVVKSGTGITIPPSGAIPNGMVAYGNVSDPTLIRARFGIGVDIFRSEPWLIPRMNNWIDYNTSLIKSIPTQYIGKVESAIRNGVMAGNASREIAKEIKRLSGVTSYRAKFIARDQVSKANADLTQYRQQDLGIKEYTWITSNDERVRPSHEAHANKVYKWSEPPANTGHPGHDYQCRCIARAIFD